jgi:6-phospho-3-hexuloisomerase
MAEKICKKVEYVNQIYVNLGEVNEQDLAQLLEAIRQAKRIILGAEGRSRSALLIGIKGIHRRLISITDSDFAWRNLKEAAIDLEQRNGKTVLLINSGSGGTTTPKEMVKDLRDYIKASGSQKFIICSVTSDTESEIAKLSDIVVRLKGRRDKEEVNAADDSIMGDIYELASAVLFQKIKEAINDGFDAKDTIEATRKEMKIVGRLIDQYLESKNYSDLVDEVTCRSRIVFGSVGPGREVAKMTTIRTRHIKTIVGDDVFLAGALAPPPKPGDVLILISFCGETAPILKWRSDYEAARGIIFSITTGDQSTLFKQSNSYVISSSLKDFYLRAVFLLSPLPGGIMAELRQCGTIIPKETIRIFAHSKTE